MRLGEPRRGAFAGPVRTAAIFGGQGDAPYAALLASDDSVKTERGLPATGLTYRVAINPSGQAIFGGTAGETLTPPSSRRREN